MKFGNLEIPTGALFAPMAGVSDKSMRILCAEYGASVAYSEMVSAKALTMGDKKSRELMRGGAGNALYAIQLFGASPVDIKEAVIIVQSSGIKFDFIDINMGCPAPKITNSGAGSALLKTPELAINIAREAVLAASCPVTVKMRIGWDDEMLTGINVAKGCEDVGVAAIAVHARTREQMYHPGVNYAEVAKIKDALNIPVLINGDIIDAQSALLALQQTNCDGVMVGRGAMGNPWVFAQIKAALNGEELPPPPTMEQILQIMRRNIYEMCAEKGEKRAMCEARSHASWYLHGLNGAAELRREACSMSEFCDIDTLILHARQLNKGLIL